MLFKNIEMGRWKKSKCINETKQQMYKEFIKNVIYAIYLQPLSISF